MICDCVVQSVLHGDHLLDLRFCFGIYLILVVVIGSGFFRVLVKLFVDWIQLSFHRATVDMSSDQIHIISCTCQAFAQFQGLSQEALWANLPRMAEGETIPFSSFITGIRR